MDRFAAAACRPRGAGALCRRDQPGAVIGELTSGRVPASRWISSRSPRWPISAFRGYSVSGSAVPADVRDEPVGANPTEYHPERCSASDSALFGTTDRPRRYPGEDRPNGDTHDRPERYPAARRLAPAWRPPPLSVAEREPRHVVGEGRPGERLRRVQLPEPALRPVVGRRLVPGPVLGVPGE